MRFSNKLFRRDRDESLKIMDRFEGPLTAVERLIKRSLSCALNLSFPYRNSNQVPTTTPAFVFDIDGVVFDKRSRLPGASRSLKYLQERNIPFVFLTNRWKDAAEEGAASIRDTFDISFSPIQYISAQSPFASLVPRFQKKLVLIIGLTAARTKAIAEFYGFESFITPNEIYAANPDLYGRFVAPDRKTDKNRKIYNTAILIFDEPQNPEQDQELVTDLLLSIDGLVGSASPKNGNRYHPNAGYQQDGQPEIWYTIKMSFEQTVSERWHELTGMNIKNTTTFGKPSYHNFSIAEKQLLETHHRLNGAKAPNLTIWMIGDSVEADIVGANLQNVNSMLCTWKSILVNTGAYESGTLNGRPLLYWPSFFSTGVWQAVQLALRQGYDHHWWQVAGGDWVDDNGTGRAVL